MRTLYEDWQLRRARLDTAEPLPHFGDQARVLDYLLNRFANDPIAQEPARFPFSSELVLNSDTILRTIIVRRHLKCGEFGATRNPADAHTRARTILTRIAKLDLQADACAPNSRINFFLLPDGSDIAPFRYCRGLFSRRVIDETDRFVARCKAQLSRGGTLCHEDMIGLKGLLRRTLSGENLKASLSEVLNALALCGYDDITSYLLECWARVIFPNALDEIETYLRTNDLGADLLRSRLASDNSAERTFAAHVLGQLGSLNDIGLLQDLLALPEMKAESAERAAYLSAINYLAGVDASI